MLLNKREGDEERRKKLGGEGRHLERNHGRRAMGVLAIAQRLSQEILRGADRRVHHGERRVIAKRHSRHFEASDELRAAAGERVLSSETALGAAQREDGVLERELGEIAPGPDRRNEMVAENAVGGVLLHEAAVRRFGFASEVEMHGCVVGDEIDAPEHARGGVVELSGVDVGHGEVVERRGGRARLLGLERSFDDGEDRFRVLVHAGQDDGVRDAN